MGQNYKQEGPVTFGDALNQGVKNGLELNEAKKRMRETVAHRLQTCRLERKLTQQELGLKVNINYLTYRGYENCKSDIPIVYLVRLADEFGVSMDYLTGRTDDRTGNVTAPKEIAATTTDQRIAQLEKLVAQLINTQSGNG